MPKGGAGQWAGKREGGGENGRETIKAKDRVAKTTREGEELEVRAEADAASLYICFYDPGSHAT